MNIPEQQRKRYLLACPLFKGLDDTVLTKLATAAQGVLLPANKVLFHQGDASNGLYVFCSGLVSVSMDDEDGNTLTLALPERGAPLGEMSLVSPDPRSATICALEDSSLLHIDMDTMLSLLRDEPALATHLIRFLSLRLRQSNEVLHRFAFENLQDRLLQKLAELGVRHGTLQAGTLDLGRKFSQSALAEMLGVTREAINKQLKLLQDQDKITIHKGIIQIRRAAEIETDQLTE